MRIAFPWRFRQRFVSPAPKSHISLYVCLAASAILALAQIGLGCRLDVLGTALVGSVFGLIQVFLLGIDLLSLIPVVFFLRYFGVALVVKTLLGQSLDSELMHPLISYLLSAAIIAVSSAVTIILRTTRGWRGVIPELRLGIVPNKLIYASAIIGIIGAAMNIGTSSRVAMVASTGPLTQLGVGLRAAFFLAIIAQTWKDTQSADRGRFISIRLAALLIIGLLISLATNARELFVDCIVSCATVLLLRQRLTIYHFLLGSILGAIFIGFISPVVLASRQDKFGQDASGFIASTAKVAGQAATDSDYLATLKEQHHGSGNGRVITTQNDYFAGRADIVNRLSWVSLVDTIYDAVQSRELLGFSSMGEVWERVEPRFLFPDKPVARNTYSDYLAYRVGLERVGNEGAYSFGLPMEGFFSFGLMGLLAYPFLGLLTILGVANLITPLTKTSIPSIFFFMTVQHGMIEQTTDGYLAILTRGMSICGIMCFLIFRYCGNGDRPRNSRGNPFSRGSRISLVQRRFAPRAMSVSKKN